MRTQHRSADQMWLAVLAALLALTACGPGRADAPRPDAGPDAADATHSDTDAGDVGDAVDAVGDDHDGSGAWVWPASVDVLVLLDGEPAHGAVVMQGGASRQVRSDERGRATIPVDASVIGELVMVASHPEARIGHLAVTPDHEGAYTIALRRYDPADNPEYAWQDPGTPRLSPNTDQCAHCHRTLAQDWYASPHRTSAVNRPVQDLYRGVALDLDRAACEGVGGEWLMSPGLADLDDREMCHIGVGVLPSLNDCDDPECVAATEFGACADCHAPAMGGALGGHDLRDATGVAYTYGVSCDVCHRVDRVDLDSNEPGVAGRLVVTRPSEAEPGPLGPWLPLTFGPSHDSPNPRMGSVQRDHFRDGTLCSGCHEHEQPVLVPDATLDTDRWPTGRLPVHTTWTEWRTGPLGDAAACDSCHMPPAPDVANGGDLQDFPFSDVGVQGGWYRPAGAVRHHSFVGPRAPDSRMLALAAALFVDASVDAGVLDVSVRTRNVGAGHAIPTGEPLRSLLLSVEAACDGAPQPAAGGDVVPDFGGYAERRDAGEGLDRWPGAQPGDELRVVAIDDAFHDYPGFGPFGDGTFTASEKGMPVERWVGSATVLEVDGDGTVTLSRPLPEGDVVYRVRDAARELAGNPGFGFARVVVGADGDRMVPHFLAVDVASDNRLLPQSEWTSRHRFSVACDEPTVAARLLHRPYPSELANERGWPGGDRVMAEVVATVGSPELAPPTVEVDERGLVELTLRAAAEGDRYTYNGTSPGPTIRARIGDRLVVEFENDLDAPSTVHWHGMHVPFAMDGVPWMSGPTPPGGTFRYEFVANRAGTFWYHPHFDTAGQVDRGLYGAIVVEDPADPAVDADLVFVLDVAGEESRESGHVPAGAVVGADGPTWLVNGEAFPTVRLSGGSLVRARFVNASNSAYAPLRWPDMRQVGSDQGLLPAPVEPDRVVLAPGDRAEFEWRIGETGFTVTADDYSLNGGDTLIHPARDILRVAVDDPRPAPAPATWSGPSGAPRPDPGHADIIWVFHGSNRTGEWRINGEAFHDAAVTEIPKGASTVMELRNLSPAEHPFHLHGMPFEVLSIDGVAPDALTIEDTINVGIRQTVRVRVDADNPGDWMAHCHILPHAEAGMMTVLRVTD